MALPIGDGRTSPIAATDVAAAVAAVLAEPGEHIGHVYELTGPEALSLEDLAGEYSRGLGMDLVPQEVPIDAFERRLEAIPGISPHIVQHLLTIARLHQEGRYNRLTTDVLRLTGNPAETIGRYIVSHRSLFTGE